MPKLKNLNHEARRNTIPNFKN